MLYNFKKGHTDKYFREVLGRTPRVVQSSFKVINEESLEDIIKNGTAVINENEAAVIDDMGTHHSVYFFKNPYYYFHNGEKPKFHIRECKTIVEYGISGFKVSNSKKVDVQGSANKLYKGLVLELCGNCRNLVISSSLTTEEFFYEQKLKYEKMMQKKGVILTDIYGYTLDWNLVSKKFRKEKNYTCEDCGINLDNGRQYCDTHHINGDKVNNSFTNLKCVCILCHANQDEHHQKNYKTRKMRKQLTSFVELYEKELIEKGNKYINVFLANKE